MSLGPHLLEGVLFLAPVLLLLGCLLLRRYPGERLLLAWLSSDAPVARAAARIARPGPGRLGHPGRLLAGRHEIRGPPRGVAVPTPC